MDFLHQIKISILFYWKAVQFIDRNSMWKYLILPAAINMIIALLTIIFAIRTSHYTVDLFLTNIQLSGTDTGINTFIEGLIMVIVRGLVFFLYLKVYRYLTLIFLSPLLEIISSKIQTIDTGLAGNPNTRKYLLGCTRNIRVSLVSFFIEIVISTFIIVVSLLVAWIIPLAPLLILLLESYFMGYILMDYRNDHHGISLRKSKKLSFKYLGLILGNGLGFNLLILLPLIGVLSAPVLGVGAAGLSINYLEKRKQILCDSNQSTLTMAQ